MKFGIEVEFVQPANKTKGQITAAIRRNANVRCYVERYNHSTRPHWKLTTDASCGLELVSPPLEGEAGLKEVRRVLTALHATGAKVNKSCGLHVHHDASEFTLDNFKNIFKNFIAQEDIFDAILPVSRRANNNQYCKTLQSANSRAIDEAATVGQLYRAVSGIGYRSRYYKLNLGAYFTHGTIEFRQHSGTVEWEKIVNWIRLTSKFLEDSKDLAEPITGIFPYRFHALMESRRRTHTIIPQRMKETKQAVYGGLNVTSTKEVKAWLAERGITLDLRKKASWGQILQMVANERQATPANNLVGFYRQRMAKLGTAHLLEAA